MRLTVARVRSLTKYGLQAAQPALQSFVQETRRVAQGPLGNGSESECGKSLEACRERVGRGAVTAGSGWISRVAGSVARQTAPAAALAGRVRRATGSKHREEKDVGRLADGHVESQVAA